MHLVAALPATFRLLAVFVAVVALLRARRPLSLALAAGALLVVALAPGAWGDPGGALARAFFNLDTLSLLLAVLATLLLAGLMREAGTLDLAVAAFRTRVRSRRAALVFFPAVVGLIPMPGGAVFSCAMVERAAAGIFPAARQAAINYWFRHIWEFAWPLYPAVALVAAMMADHGVRYPAYLAAQAPMSAVALLAGILFMLRGASPRDAAGDGEIERADDAVEGGFLEGLSPILVVVGAALLLGALAEHSATAAAVAFIPEKLRLFPACLVAIAWTAVRHRLDAAAFRRAARDSHLASMGLTILAIALFSGIIKESGLAREIGAEFTRSGVPLPLVAVCLPFLTGMVTGVTIAMIGASFPILFALSDAAGAPALPLTVLAYAAGFVGIMVSPMHLCLALTAGHFRVGLAAVLRIILAPSAALLAAAGLLYRILS